MTRRVWHECTGEEGVRRTHGQRALAASVEVGDDAGKHVGQARLGLGSHEELTLYLP